MSRFSKLEISNPDKLRPKPSEPEDRRSDRDYVERGDKCFREGGYEAALKYYSRSLNKNPKIESAWLGQLLCLINLGEHKEAVIWADKALEIFPNSGDIVACKALAWGRAGDLDKAMGFSDTSMKMNSGSSMVWWCRGDIVMGSNPRTGMFCFAKAMETDKDSWALMFRIAKTLLTYRRPGDAKTYLHKALHLAPDIPIVWHYLGVANLNLGLPNKALEAFKKALDLNPQNLDAKEAIRELENMGNGNRLFMKLKSWFNR